MSWGMNERQAGRVTVLELSGRLVLGEGSDSLDEKLQSLIAGGCQALLLDCHQVSALDSRGIKTLVRALTSITQRGGKLKLLQPSARMQQVLEMTRLHTVLESFDNEQEALESLTA